WAATWASRAMLDEASQAILLNRDLLRATFENVSQGIGMFDPELRFAAWNRRFLELLGISEELAQIGTSLARIVESPERRRSAMAVDLSMLQGAPAPHTYERRRSDGRVLELQTNPMPSGGFVLVCTDITERTQTLEALKDSERRVREANELLERRVGERTRELTQLNAELSNAKAAAEAANVGKTRFLAAASHDLLQPLHAARLFAGALAERPRSPKAGAVACSSAAGGKAIASLSRCGTPARGFPRTRSASSSRSSGGSEPTRASRPRASASGWRSSTASRACSTIPCRSALGRATAACS